VVYLMFDEITELWGTDGIDFVSSDASLLRINFALIKFDFKTIETTEQLSQI